MNVAELSKRISDTDGVGWKIALALLNAMGGVILSMSLINFRYIERLNSEISSLRESTHVKFAQVKGEIDVLPPDLYEGKIRSRFEDSSNKYEALKDRVQALEFLVGRHNSNREIGR